MPVADHLGFWRCHLLQSLQGLLGLTLLNHPHRRIKHDDGHDDDGFNRIPQQSRDN